MTTDTIIVRIRHVRQAGYCASGTRAWFERHGVDYMAFLKNGIDIKKVLEFNDHFANEVALMATKERERELLKEACDG